MNPDITVEITTKLLTQLADQYYYAEKISHLLPKVAFIVLENEQLRDLIDELVARSDFMLTQEINWVQLSKQERKIICSFFDYLYFTSPEFQKEVQ